jgi:DDE superfamily endonuclease
VLKPWLKREWCIPPKEDAAFVARMEDVLDVYARPPDPARPLVCFDEGSKELHGEVRDPLPMIPGHPLRYDTEYERHGTANLFLWCAPLLGKRNVTVTEHRTRRDFASAIRDLVDVQFPHAERIVLVLDNLNTHDPASLYLAFPPAEAKRLWDKLEVHPTPTHGSWLNIAEIELSVLGRQCLDRRLADRETLATEVTTWVAARNAEQVTVDWQFTTADARTKLKHLYPVLEPVK